MVLPGDVAMRIVTFGPVKIRLSTALGSRLVVPGRALAVCVRALRSHAGGSCPVLNGVESVQPTVPLRRVAQPEAKDPGSTVSTVILPFDLPAVDGEPPCRQSRYEAWLTGTAKSGEPHEMLGLAASDERWFDRFRPGIHSIATSTFGVREFRAGSDEHCDAAPRFRIGGGMTDSRRSPHSASSVRMSTRTVRRHGRDADRAQRCSQDSMKPVGEPNSAVQRLNADQRRIDRRLPRRRPCSATDPIGCRSDGS